MTTARTDLSDATMRQALTAALFDIMDADDNAIMLGEALDTRGGAALVTYGFLDKFGPRRAIETPISENALVGMALGAAVAGLTVIAEVYSADFLFCAGSEIVNDIAKWRYQHQWEQPLNLVLRMPAGSARSWSGPEHTQAIEGLLNNIPGIRVVVPSDTDSAAAALIASTKTGDPVVFLEHRSLYNTKHHLPAVDATDNILGGRILREGADVTIVAWGSMVHVALAAAEDLAAEGVAAEVIDPISVKPMNHDLISTSLAKTRRLIVVDEGPRTGSVAAEVIVRALEDAAEPLHGFRRVTFPDVHHPFSPSLEADLTPQPADVVEAARSIV